MLSFVIFVLLVIGIMAWGKKQISLACFDLIWAFFLIVDRSDLSRASFSQTREILLLMILFVNVGYLFGAIKLTKTPKKSEQTNETQEKLVFNEKFFELLLSLAFVIALYYCALTIMRHGLDLQAIRKLNNSDSEERIFSSLVDTILFYGVCQPLICLGFLVLAYNFYNKIKTKKTHIALLIGALVLSIVARAGRTILIQAVVFFVAAFLWTVKSKENKINKKKVVLFVVLAYFALNLMTVMRTGTDNSFLNQLLSYFKGSIAHMNVRLDAVDPDTTYCGYVTYGGFLYYPVKLLENLLGLDMETSNDIMGFLQKQIVVYVDGEVKMYNALLPNAYYYFFDSGIPGVVVFSTILGFCAKKTENRYKCPSFMTFVFWACAVYGILYSGYGAIFWNLDFATCVIWCFLLKKSLYKKEKTNGQNCSYLNHCSNLRR